MFKASSGKPEDVKIFVTMATFSVPDSLRVKKDSLIYSTLVGQNNRQDNISLAYLGNLAPVT